MTKCQRLVLSAAQTVQLSAGRFDLLPAQQHYLQRVLRLPLGAEFIAIAAGQWWRCQWQGTWATVAENLVNPRELHQRLQLAVALPKGSGFEEVVRQTVPLGITELVPLVTARTLYKGTPKLERWHKIAAEAAEQSLRSHVPAIPSPQPFGQWLTTGTAAQKFLAVPRLAVPHLLSQDLGETVAIATGPEGGWTPAEEEQAIAAGFVLVSLGRRVLTAVLAPVVAAALVVAKWEHDETAVL
ncbi:MAG: RsmE family RNA methyltransferase [Pseudanabaenaceae cyanobacterium]